MHEFRNSLVLRGFIFLIVMVGCVPCLNAQDSKTDPSAATIAIVVDCSGSLRLQLDKTVSLIKQIAESMRPGDEAFIVRFVSVDKISVTQDLTHSRSLRSRMPPTICILKAARSPLPRRSNLQPNTLARARAKMPKGRSS